MQYGEVVRRIPLPFASFAAARPDDSISATIETVHFKISGAKVFVEDQDPYLLPGFIPCGKAVSLEIELKVVDGFTPSELRTMIERQAAHMLVDTILDGKLMFKTTKRDSDELVTNHRFSVYITQGS